MAARGAPPFLVLGAVTFAVLFVCGFFVRRPIETEKSGGGEGLTTGQMLKKPKFWFYYLWELMLTAAGLMIASQASGITADALPAVSAGAAATLVGLISIANGLGRVLFGTLYDKAGRRVSMLLICLCPAAAMGLLLVAVKTSGTAVLTCAFILLGLGYGGIPVCNSAFIGASFGMAHYQTNFPVCNSAMLPASFGGTLAGALYDGAGAYSGVFLVILALQPWGCSAPAASRRLDRTK